MREDAFGGGTVDLVVLSAVRMQGESYGYAIGRDLTQAGVTGLGEAAIYACLRRLHERGLLASRQVVADNGKARRYYALTPSGQEHLEGEVLAWKSRRNSVDKIIEAGRKR
jgi:DNA-binding PadR family transcriptional regulator